MEQEAGHKASGSEFQDSRAPLPAVDDYDVWVSCERIVERQVVRAKGPIFSRKEGIEGNHAVATREASSQQSAVESAKYYQELTTWRFLDAARLPRSAGHVSNHSFGVDPSKASTPGHGRSAPLAEAEMSIGNYQIWLWLAILWVSAASLWLATGR